MVYFLIYYSLVCWVTALFMVDDDFYHPITTERVFFVITAPVTFTVYPVVMAARFLTEKLKYYRYR